MGKRRKLNFRKSERPQKEYKRKIIISAEGKKTEAEYFRCIKEYSKDIILIINRKTGRSSPTKVFDDLKRYITGNPLMKNDEAWMVIDIDQWPKEQLEKIFFDIKNEKRIYCAVSNPKFEYWLLLHFEDPKNHMTSNQCDKALKKHIIDYNKGVPSSRISIKNIMTAIKNAKKRHFSNEKDYPKNNGSTLYLLVEKIIRNIE